MTSQTPAPRRNDASGGGFIPPYLSEEWRNLRSDLLAAGEISSQAAALSTTEDIHPLLTLALSQLSDASFWLARIERDATTVPLPGLEE